MPKKALSNIELMRYAKETGIPNFRGVFMRDTLPKRPWLVESGIVNLDSVNNKGTHWVSYIKKGNAVSYFDSYGNLAPPREFMHYMRDVKNISYNRVRYQKDGTSECGRLALLFLRSFL